MSAEQMIYGMLVNHSDEFEIHRDGQLIATVNGFWNSEDHFIGFAEANVDVRPADRIVGKQCPNQFRALDVYHLPLQTRATVETEGAYQRRLAAQQPQIRVHIKDAAIQHNSAGATQRVSIVHGKHEGPWGKVIGGVRAVWKLIRGG